MNCLKLHNPGRGSRRGVAMILVLVAIAIASVLGMAMLSTASLQNQMSANASTAAQAEALAESGLNMGLYYLQNPSNSPTSPALQTNTFGEYYWPGTGGDATIGSPGIGVVNVTVTPDTVNRSTYTVVATGTAGGGSSVISRVAQARVYVKTEYQVRHAAAFAENFVFPSSTLVTYEPSALRGDVLTNKLAKLVTGAVVNGRVYRSGILTPTATPRDGWAALPRVPVYVPVTVRDYTTYLDPATGETCHAHLYSDGSGTVILDGRATPIVLGPEPGNPAGIHIINGNLDLSPGVYVNGTLVVKGHLMVGRDALLALNTENVFTAADGFPALVVEGELRFQPLTGIGRTFTVNGVCQVGQRITASLTNLLCVFRVNGGLLVGGTNPIFQTFTVKPILNYDPARVRVPDLCEQGRTPVAVRIESWRQGN